MKMSNNPQSTNIAIKVLIATKGKPTKNPTIVKGKRKDRAAKNEMAMTFRNPPLTRSGDQRMVIASPGIKRAIQKINATV